MSRSRLPALLLATLPAFAAGAGAGAVAEGEARAEETGRYPVWPTEIDRIAAPLRDPGLMAESARMAALEELSEYATEVIAADIELALTDPAPEVRNLALGLCIERRLVACVDEAVAMWDSGEGGVRFTALELLSIDPSEEHLERLYDAMRDPNDLIREHAINLLVDAPLHGTLREAARREIVGQLGDVSARVRRAAALGLGRMGPGAGALALVRLLDDVDAGVAQEAARALGKLGDARAAPALLRALESPGNPDFASVAVRAVASLPGEEIDRALLEFLDTPPRNTRRSDVARAIGNRLDPSIELITGLVERMRDPDLREQSTRALLWMGDRTVSALEAALERGLEPDIALEIGRLLAARSLEPTEPAVLDEIMVEGRSSSGASASTRAASWPAMAASWPAMDAREAWFERLADGEDLGAGVALAQAAPIWFEGSLSWHLERGASAGQVRPWLVALAVSEEAVLGQRDHAIVWGRVASWAADAGASAESRCLAALALGRAVGTRHEERVLAELQRLAGAHSEDVRACAGASLVRFGDDPTLDALLADPSPRVRAMTAAAASSLRRLDEQVRMRLAVQADRDSETRARTSAAATLALAEAGGRQGREAQPFVFLLASPVSLSPAGAQSSRHWQRFEFGGQPMDLPVFGSVQPWTILPLPGATVPEVDTGAMRIEDRPYGVEGLEIHM